MVLRFIFDENYYRNHKIASKRNLVKRHFCVILRKYAPPLAEVIRLCDIVHIPSKIEL